MRCIISGSHGFIGSAIVADLAAEGHRVVRLVRDNHPSQPDSIVWHPMTGALDLQQLEGVDVIIHLAGESVDGRWTTAKKARILQSRVNSTRLLSESIARLTRRPKVLICASATGFYGNRGDEILTEDSAVGDSFLADVCREWEAAAQPAREAGVRVVQMRFGVVLSSHGGALPKMLTPFRLGVGGMIGNGRQYLSWVTLDDVVRAIRFAVATLGLRGPVNVVAPHPVTNQEFIRTLGHVLRRPMMFPLPASVVRLIFGEMGDEVLLGSLRVQPQRLLTAGFQFHHGELAAALRFTLDPQNSR